MGRLLCLGLAPLSRDELDAVTALDSSARIGADPAKAAFTQM
jgi:hypothetical protein